MLEFKILGIPQAKQSARFRVVGNGKKRFVQSYQPKSVKDMERNIAFDVKSQLPVDFIPFDCPIGVEVLFVFPPLKSWRKSVRDDFLSGKVIYKHTRPDLTDNLMKGLFDAMDGIVFVDDSRICKVSSEKIFGEVPRTEVVIYELENN